MNITDKINAYLESRIRIYPVHSNRASEIGHCCTRYLVYKRVAWDQAQRHSVDLQRVFEEGNIQEAAFIETCRKAGFEILESQRDFDIPKENITSHIDGVILDNSTGERRVFEFKSCSPNVFAALSRYKEDEFLRAMTELQDKYFWLAHYPAQIMTYLYNKDKEEGLFIFKNKTNGSLKVFTVKLDTDYLDGIFKKAAAINEYVAKIKPLKEAGIGWDAELPERIDNRDRCQDCAFNHLCLPSIQWNKPLTIEDSPDFCSKLDKWFSLKEASSEYDSLDKEITEKCRGRDRVVVNNKYLITGKETKGGGWRKQVLLIATIDEIAKKIIELGEDK